MGDDETDPRAELEALLSRAEEDSSEQSLENFHRMTQLMQAIDPNASLEDLAQALVLQVFYRAGQISNLSGIGFIDYPEAQSLNLNDELRQTLQELGPRIEQNFKMVHAQTPEGEQVPINMGHALASLDCQARGNPFRGALYSFGGDALKIPSEICHRIADAWTGRETDQTAEPGSLTADDEAGDVLGRELGIGLYELRHQGLDPGLPDLIGLLVPTTYDPGQGDDPLGVDADSEPELPDFGSSPDLDTHPEEIDGTGGGAVEPDANEPDFSDGDGELSGSDIDRDGSGFEPPDTQPEGPGSVDPDQGTGANPDEPEELGDRCEPDSDLQGSDADADFACPSRGDAGFDVDPDDVDGSNRGDPDSSPDFNEPDDDRGSRGTAPSAPSGTDPGGSDPDADTDPGEIDDWDEEDADADFEEPR